MPFPDGTRLIHNIKKEYPHMICIKIYNEPLIIKPHQGKTGKRKKKNNYEPDERSVRRTQQLISDYTICNEFDLFCTFTLDPKKFKKREDFSACYLKIQSWLHSQRTSHSPDLKYLVVPERHKAGGYHFHALLANYNGLLSDSGHKKDNRPIFNISGWRFGFSTAVKIPKEDVKIVSRYVRKYITKDMSKEFGRKRFLASRNLVRPAKSYNVRDFRDTLPLGRRKIYDAGSYSIYELNPEFLQKVKKKSETYAELIRRQKREEEQKLFFSSN